MRRAWDTMLSRITGFSTPVFGVQWTPSADERKVAQEAVSFLEDRRVLFVPHEAELPHHCVESVEGIRVKLTELIGRLTGASILQTALRHMRAACREFLSRVVQDERYVINGFEPGHYASWVFLPALGELRARIGVQIAIVSTAYGIDVEDQIIPILPPNVEEEE